MGLDVRVYQNIKQTNNQDEADLKAHVIDSDWEWKIKNLSNGASYTGDCVDSSISSLSLSISMFTGMLILRGV